MILTLYQWQKTIKPQSELIIQASSKGNDDAWRPWPIGMSFRYVMIHELGDALQLGNHDKLVLNAVSASTDSRRRPTGLNRYLFRHTLHVNGFPTTIIHHDKYFSSMPSYKFVISPEGNGIDCHRHYEALFAGCIPIMEKNPLIEEKYKGCPILWTTDYSEITREYLEEKYKEMLHTEYDFFRLFLSYYDTETQALIKDAGNFWLSQVPETASCVWYK